MKLSGVVPEDNKAPRNPMLQPCTAVSQAFGFRIREENSLVESSLPYCQRELWRRVDQSFLVDFSHWLLTSMRLIQLISLVNDHGVSLAMQEVQA